LHPGCLAHTSSRLPLAPPARRPHPAPFNTRRPAPHPRPPPSLLADPPEYYSEPKLLSVQLRYLQVGPAAALLLLRCCSDLHCLGASRSRADTAAGAHQGTGHSLARCSKCAAPAQVLLPPSASPIGGSHLGGAVKRAGHAAQPRRFHPL
jgi:hypothetical protein